MNKIFEALRNKEKNYDYMNKEHQFGFLFDCFVTQDDDLNEAMKLIKDDKLKFEKSFITAYKRNLEFELETIEEKFNAIEDCDKTNCEYFYKPQIEMLTKKLKIESIEDFIRNDELIKATLILKTPLLVCVTNFLFYMKKLI